MIYNPIDSESFYVFFKFLGWTSKQKNINFLITPGCLWLPVVLCSCPMVKLHFCNLFFLCWYNLEKFYYLFIMPCVFLACCIVDPIILWLCQLVVLDACKGATHDCLNVGLVSYQVPIGSATIKMTIYTSSVVHFWTTEANHYTVYMYMYINMYSLA